MKNEKGEPYNIKNSTAAYGNGLVEVFNSLKKAA